MKPKLILCICVIVVIIALIGLLIYALVVYGDKPITEIPSWAFWLMH